MDPTALDADDALHAPAADDGTARSEGLSGTMTAEHPEALVLLEHGHTDQHIVYDARRVEARRVEREREAFAQQYAAYAANTPNPATFEQFMAVIRSARA